MNKKRILYIGGFEMPNGNAAAHRVFAIAKALRGEFSVSFVGLTRQNNLEGVVDGFCYRNLEYPSNHITWVKHLSGDRELSIIKQIKPDIVIAYNFPALGLYRIMRYCRKTNIKIIGDITEWYSPHNFPKRVDTAWRMKYLNFKMNGLIVISHFLADYYRGVSTILIPPTTDTQDNKWTATPQGNRDEGIILLLYAGSPGRGDKDRLDGLVKVLPHYSNMLLNVVGINEEQFRFLYKDVIIPNNVVFHGRLSHEDTIQLLNNSDFSIFFRQQSRVNNAGFPTKFAESQTSGVPVISNNYSDLKDYVTEGVNGFLAEGYSIQDIDKVLNKVSALKREDIDRMHKITRSLRSFDYRNYSEELMKFVSSIY